MRFLSAFSLSTNSKTAWTSKREREKKSERDRQTERALEGRKRKRCFGKAMCVVFKKDCRVLQKRDAFFFKVFFFFFFFLLF